MDIKKVSNIESMLFLNQKFQILSMKANESTSDQITDSYVYAWYQGVYPFFDDVAEWHIPYKEFFSVTEEMMGDLSKLLHDRWMSESFITFCELEEHYGVNNSVWDTSKLTYACRYMYLNDSFDQGFWTKLCENIKCPPVAHPIMRDFKVSDIYFV